MGSGTALAAYLRRTRAETIDRCATACGKASRHCLERAMAGGEDRARSALASSLARDCEEICRLAAPLLAREAELAPHALLACKLACRQCAQACDAFPADEVVAECSLLCRQVETICHRAAGTGLA
jgi:hypothetical protein